jgi:hypothetical protein
MTCQFTEPHLIVCLSDASLILCRSRTVRPRAQSEASRKSSENSSAGQEDKTPKRETSPAKRQSSNKKLESQLLVSSLSTLSLSLCLCLSLSLSLSVSLSLSLSLCLSLSVSLCLSLSLSLTPPLGAAPRLLVESVMNSMTSQAALRLVKGQTVTSWRPLRSFKVSRLLLV